MRASTKAEMVEHLHEELSMNKCEAKELVGLLLEETRYAFKDDE